MDLVSLLDILAVVHNKNAILNSRHSIITKEVMIGFFGVYFIMAINNISNNHSKVYFANNKINGPNDKAVKVCLLLDRFDLVLSASLGDNKSQRINDYVCILKWRSSIEQSIKTKLIK